MKKYIDITSNEFWDILYNEACVEGRQAKRIEKDLEAITTTEAEIRAKVIDEFITKLKEHCKQYCDYKCMFSKCGMFGMEPVVVACKLDRIAEKLKEVE